MKLHLLAAGLLLCTGHASAAEQVERSEILTMGAKAGFQEARYADDGSIKVHYEFNDRGRGPKMDAEYRVGADGSVARIANTGIDYFKGPVDETFSRDGSKVSWKNSAEDASQELTKPSFYLSLNGTPEEFVLLTRALLKSDSKSLDILPAGSARVEKLSELKVKGKPGAKKVTLYAIHGLDTTPSYLWLDEQQRFFASYSSWQSVVRDGYADALSGLGKVQDAQEKQQAEQRATSLTEILAKPLLIRNVRTFDPASGTITTDAAVLIDKGRIVAAGKAADVGAPAGADTMDGGGRFLMPGLWDMHAHFFGQADGVLDIAGGVTTIRDLANNPPVLAERIKSIEANKDIGPRIIKAGIIDGPGPFAGPTKALADNEADAQRIVDEYAASGHEQIKIYSSIKPELMPAIARMAHAKGLRVSGHVPAFMTARQFVDNGADEIQHINMLMLNFLFDKVQDTRSPARFTAIGEYGAGIDLGSPQVLEFVQHLKQKDIVVDPTVSTFEDMFLGRPKLPGPGWAAILDRLPLTWQRGIKSGAGGLPIKPGQEAAYRDGYQRMIDYVGLLYRSGVRIVSGTDGSGGLQLARELELYVAAGIPPKDVLRIATYDSAAVMKRDKEYGRIAPGYVADLILVDGDPTLNMADIRKVRTVIRGDRRYDSAKLFTAIGIKPSP
ncbi:cytosine/adenosine deaminase-related metal-dependent hydrolase [Tahibacter aquaticus]|uniref:Cytosine/adenosine deaminase-related metal-dependent hydrolase n=1 Tax=Tahibacter aquaticus TaxID=520092 RepID=A0A4R6YT56_9GAMM|nr:amidohydrolase family protein [Tahibacter aquaticus]TDR41297.1 cytosine/adenosine deaminase-related metal-dependent hydrolase [Tahibacter aquaticus]